MLSGVALVHHMTETIEIPKAKITQLISLVVSQGKRIDKLEDELEELREHSAKDRAEIRTDVESVRETAKSTSESGGEDGEDTHPETKIEEVASLPDDVVENQLSKNERRSVHVARRIMDYAKSTPGGRVIDAAAICEVLRDIEAESTHTETVSRIRDFLVKFGEGAIEQVERRGKQLLAFDDDLARRLGSHRGEIDGSRG